jgi:hypothetical protein
MQSLSVVAENIQNIFIVVLEAFMFFFRTFLFLQFESRHLFW